MAVRARIVLRCAEPGAVYERIAADLGVTTMTVGSGAGGLPRRGWTACVMVSARAGRRQGWC